MRFKIQVSVRTADGTGYEWKDLRPSDVTVPYTWDTREDAQTAMNSLYPLRSIDVVRVIEA